MPWTKTNYPDAMKKLPSGIRNKAIEIANAMLKDNKKMKEGIVIATAIKKATGVSVGGDRKRKNAAKKKVKSTAKRKAKSPAKKTTKKTAKKKVKAVAGKKAKSAAKKKIKNSAAKKVRSSARKEIKNSPPETALPEIKTPSENIPAIPVQGGMHPITPLEAHTGEKIIHQREEVSFQQENLRAKQAMASRKNLKRTYRMFGPR